ncbi:MAG: SOS response-associated peptidase [Chloroflexi bacterium]|nr:SOS response-associated peptidase [Chloroflexota bacterium]
MCGRFTLITDPSALQARFDFDAAGLALAPSYNVAPTHDVLTVTNDGDKNVGQLMRWGLIPSWAKDMSIGNRMINARAETVMERPSFRSAFRSRRCLVVADGFYEWQKVGPSKRPMRIAMKTGEPFAFAGLWERWKAPEGGPILSCTIITTNANELMSPIHERMPVILPREVESLWLDPEQDAGMLAELLVPYPDLDDLEAYEVSTLVNSPRNNEPALIARAG